MVDAIQNIVSRYRDYVRSWRMFYALLITCHFTFGSAAVVAPALIGFDLFGAAEDTPAKILAAIGAVSAALVAFLRPSQYAQGFYSAYSLLEGSLDRFGVGPGGEADRIALVDAYDKARALIGAVQPGRGQAVDDDDADGDGR